MQIAIPAEDHGLVGIAQPRCRLDNRIEHRLQIECRAADDLQHVAGRGLIFQRFLKFIGASTHFVQKPRVFHRDHRLGREVLQQGYLLFGECADFTANRRDVAEQGAILAHRHMKNGPHIGMLDERASHLVARHRFDRRVVRDVDEPVATQQWHVDRVGAERLA